MRRCTVVTKLFLQHGPTFSFFNSSSNQFSKLDFHIDFLSLKISLLFFDKFLDRDFGATDF